MRQRLVKVLKSEEEDASTRVALRVFWSLSRPVLAAGPGRSTDAQVVDLARWVYARAKVVRT
jgi:hypothetical protein